MTTKIDTTKSEGAMERIIRAAVERGASDLHIKAGDVFRARIEGKLVPLTKQRLTPDQTRAIALKLLTTDEDRARLESVRDYDCSWGMPGVGRFRVNILRQRSSIMIVMRVIPFAVPTLASLNLPGLLARLVESERGLLIVAGVSGGGKSSTMAALVHHINQTQQKHVVTVENPIEFLHRDLTCSVTQREVGVDTATYASGLRAALRQDPDVVVIGELADADTVATAIKAAESGFLVITSMPTPDVATTVERLVSMLPKDEREIGRVRFAECLRAIVAQQLLPRHDEAGSIVACEVLVTTPEVRAALRDTARISDLKELMGAGSALGMQTFEQQLAALVTSGKITAEAARAVTLPTAASPPPAGVPERRKRSGKS
jgi:twitching motility protein PilT